ncbi:MAG: hypothetical protein Q9207_006846 [Kuettlingeria erythrocarpa]
MLYLELARPSPPCLYNKPEAFNLLLERNPDVNAHGRYGTPLQAAAYSGAKAVVRELLRRAADIKFSGQGRYGHSLQSAAIRAREDVVRFLIKQGADVGMKRWAVWNGASGRKRSVLEDIGRLPHAQGSQGKRARWAIQDRFASRLCGQHCKPLTSTVILTWCVLVEHGANINVKGGFYDAVADACAMNAHPSILRYLIKDGNIKPGTTGPRYGQAKSKAKRAAEETVSDAEAKSEVDERRGTETKKNTEAEDEAEDLEGPSMNIESIRTTTPPPHLQKRPRQHPRRQLLQQIRKATPRPLQAKVPHPNLNP